jgi:hypothetical protein
MSTAETLVFCDTYMELCNVINKLNELYGKQSFTVKTLLCTCLPTASHQYSEEILP